MTLLTFSVIEAKRPLEDKFADLSPMFLGWSEWSVWSKCSSGFSLKERCLGNGLQFQLRRCLDIVCSGISARHRLCGRDSYECLNNGHVDREKIRKSGPEIECAIRSRKNTPITDELISLTPNENCSLSCQSKKSGTIYHYSVSLKDGEECKKKNAERAVCFKGTCQMVGCDDIVGSSARIDQCGVCAGNGTSCAKTLFRWREAHKKFSSCDKTCGPNSVQVSISECINTRTEKAVPDQMCANIPKPRPVVRRCPFVICPAKWVTGLWNDCSVTCGVGEQIRDVYCVQSYNEEPGQNDENLPGISNHRVADQFCWKQPRPIDTKKCDTKLCPQWETGDWDQCSVSCGHKTGIRRRIVKCRYDDEQYANDRHCEFKAKPIEEQLCYTGITCPSPHQHQHELRPSSVFTANHLSPLSASSEEYSSYSHIVDTPTFTTGSWSECSVTCGQGIQTRTVECLSSHGIGNAIKLPDYECKGQIKPSPFQPCSAHIKCDSSAIRSVKYPQQSDILIYNDMGKSQNTNQLENKVLTTSYEFHWEHGDWGPCSVSCLGGRQRARAICIAGSRKKIVPNFYCEGDGKLPRPADMVRHCNRHACLPIWEMDKFGECSHSCGGGIRTRHVRCIRKVSRTLSGTLILPESQCPGPRPQETKPCGIIDCPFHWSIGSWDPCSTSCGPGEQRRSVRCEQRDSLGEIHMFRPDYCATILQQKQPLSTRICDLGPCSKTSNDEFTGPLSLPLVQHFPRVEDESFNEKLPIDKIDQTTDDQENILEKESSRKAPRESNKSRISKHNRRLTMNVGGLANLFEGTSIKVKCPFSSSTAINPMKNSKTEKAHSRQAMIKWYKDGRKIIRRGRIKVTENGDLRIRSAQSDDAGTYSCFSADGMLQGNVTLHFKQLPVENEIKSRKTSKQKPEHTSAENRKMGDLEAPFVKPIDEKMLKKVRESLYRAGDRQMLSHLSLMGKFVALNLDYAASDWSQCPSTVRGCFKETPGQPQEESQILLQVRVLKCRVHIPGANLPPSYVDDDVCDAFGISRPPDSKPCEITDIENNAETDFTCPQWKVDEWSQCMTSQCIRQKTAIQRRNVHCIFVNETDADISLCDRKTRPKLKKECVNPLCMAEWKPLEWGKCSKTCGDGGVQMRLLLCVWRSTNRPAGENCNVVERPPAIRTCESDGEQLAPCPELTSYDIQHQPSTNYTDFGGNRTGVCFDESRYCDILQLFKTCEQPAVKQRCCYSCYVLAQNKTLGKSYSRRRG